MVSFSSEAVAKLDEIVRLFEEAELEIKAVEGLQKQLGVPSINQLRYAGYHLAKAYRLNAADEELVLAERHCKRAIFDTGEAAIFFYLDYFDAFHKAYGSSDALPPWCDNYADYLMEVNRIHTEIEDIRENNYDNRYDFYQQSKEGRKSLHSIYLKLRAIEPTVSQCQQEIDRKEARSARRFLVATFIGIATLVVAVVALFNN